MKIVLTIFWFILAVACIVYAFCIMAVDSGTKFFIVWFFAGIVFILFGLAVHFSLWGRLPKILQILFLVIVFACLTVFVLVEGMVLSRFKDEAKSNLEYIVVLGAQIKEDGPSVVLKYRLDKAIEYLDKNPDTKCIVTGAKGDNEPITEAEGMARYLIDHGISEERIIKEDKSKNTVENIKNSNALVGLKDKNFGIVTSNFHMYRAFRIAKKQGLLGAEGIAANSTPFYLPNNMVREFAGVIKDLIMGNLFVI